MENIAKLKILKTMATQKLRCYLALPYSDVSEGVREVIISGVQQAGFQILSQVDGKVALRNSMQDEITGDIARSDCLVADITDDNPNVFVEIGIARGMGKAVFLFVENSRNFSVPLELREFNIQTYSTGPDGLSALTKLVVKTLREFRRFPKRKPTLRGSAFPPYFVDWDKLTLADTENICKELLTQMGFKRIDWEKRMPEIDMVAELPKKDPDGFEYRELWLISMGLRGPIEMLIDMVTSDSEYLIHRFSRYFDEHRARSAIPSAAPFTVLFVMTRNSSGSDEYEMINDILRRRSKRGAFGSNVRLRIWDQPYLTSLIHQFPQIGYKYFSDEGRLRSETRKSYEDLYHENSDMMSRQVKLISELEDERNRRVSAERDAVWKDISFSAAHKIGNPIFAIETDLDPLAKRIRENRNAEAIDVLSNIRSAVEKAKGFVEQFKSLAKAQQIKPVPILFKLILDDALKTICNQEIQCEIECPPQIEVLGDLERLVECFDELVMNSAHWFDKDTKKITVKVTSPPPESLPSELNSKKSYILIHFIDNGCGVPLSQKNQIFDAFFTTNEHGSGLGLALVRRIIEGHGGLILENGVPGKGADFEIYLPSPEKDAGTENRLIK